MNPLLVELKPSGIVSLVDELRALYDIGGDHSES